jgi:hypothetical protein
VGVRFYELESSMISRRDWLRVTAGSLALGAAGASRLAAAVVPPAKEATVYKTPTCGCCKKWVEHMQKAGYRVTAHDVDDVSPYKKKYGVPAELGTCHTAVVSGGYIVEGHVPSDVVDKLITEKPAGVVGIGVAGMPAGSPGMEAARNDKYEVMSFDKTGKTKVYARRG